ncbi:MAG: hypothetical protein ACLFQB_10480 [Chitinispirillaceae bacterium]
MKKPILKLVLFVSVFSNCISLNPIPRSDTDMEKQPLSHIVLEEEIALIKAGAKCTHIILLETEVSFSSKTVKVYLDQDNNCIMIFHFNGFYDHDAELYDIEFRTSEELLDLGKIDKNEHVVAGNLLDEYMIKQVQIETFRKLAHADTLSGSIGDIEFAVSYADRAKWRDLISD